MAETARTFVDDGTATSTPLSDRLAISLPSDAARTSELSETSEPKWVAAVAEEFVSLNALNHGWDGYGAGPIRSDVLNFATELLARIMLPGTPPPHLTPMSHEGIMIEWHQHGIELEIEIEAPAQVWVCISVDGQEEEWPMRNDFNALSDSISELTRRAAPAC
jgi:hypothetical protein